VFVRQGRAVLVYRPFRVRMNRSAQPFPSGARTKAGELSRLLLASGVLVWGHTTEAGRRRVIGSYGACSKPCSSSRPRPPIPRVDLRESLRPHGLGGRILSTASIVQSRCRRYVRTGHVDCAARKSGPSAALALLDQRQNGSNRVFRGPRSCGSWRLRVVQAAGPAPSITACCAYLRRSSNDRRWAEVSFIQPCWSRLP
jgi:hypothetical protein